MLPRGFRFTQSSLQDYVDCRRRFQLRYDHRQAWPAVQAEPLMEHERHLDRGARFHRLVERHQLGLPADVLAASIHDQHLEEWWASYLDFHYLHDLPGVRHPEFTLSVELAGSRLAATYDLLVIVPGERAVIFDWKTYRQSPPRQWFESRLQTRVYPFVLAAVAHLPGGVLYPSQISMVYWVTGAPSDPIIFEYSEARFAEDTAYLTALVREVLSMPDGEAWPLTVDEVRCRFCEYRSLCGRGVRAGSVDEWDLFDSGVDLADLLSLADVDEVGF